MATKDEPLEDRKIVQSRLGMKLTYEFGPEKLIYTRADLSGTYRCSAAYEHFGIGNPSYLALNNRLFTVVSLVATILAFIVTAVVILAYRLAPWLVVIPMWVIPFSFLMIRLHSPFALHFVQLPVSADALGGQGPAIWLWDEARGQVVMDELETRWRARLRSLYAHVDPHNEAEREATKFDWLRGNEIIDEAEYQTALGEIELHCWVSGTERSLN